MLGGQQARRSLDVEVARRPAPRGPRRRRGSRPGRRARRARARGRRAGRRSSAPRARDPTRRSLRKLDAHSTSPGSTGSAKLKTRFVTAPLEAITTTITTRGCSASTSTRWTRAADGGGAVATASRSVIRDSAEVVSRSASSISRRICREVDRPAGGPRLAARREQGVGVEAVAGVGRHAPGRGVRVGQVSLALEHRELGPYRRRAPVDRRVLGDRRRADRLARLEVGVDDEGENLLLAVGEHQGRF